MELVDELNDKILKYIKLGVNDMKNSLYKLEGRREFIDNVNQLTDNIATMHEIQKIVKKIIEFEKRLKKFKKNPASIVIEDFNFEYITEEEYNSENCWKNFEKNATSENIEEKINYKIKKNIIREFECAEREIKDQFDIDMYIELYRIFNFNSRQRYVDDNGLLKEIKTNIDSVLNKIIMI